MASGLPAWWRREAFEYVESLAGPLLAWEYLRRNLSYRTAWDLCDPTTARPPVTIGGYFDCLILIWMHELSFQSGDPIHRRPCGSFAPRARWMDSNSTI
jgi:hypothetical protein